MQFIFIYLVAQAQFSNNNIKTAEIMVGCFIPDYNGKYFNVIQVRIVCGNFYIDIFLKITVPHWSEQLGWWEKQ